MKKIKEILIKRKFYTNKYFIVSIVFLAYLIFLSPHNLIERINAIKKNNELLKQKEYYINLIKKHSDKIKELTTNKEMLEKFVREEYLMKKKNEVIFVLNDTLE